MQLPLARLHDIGQVHYCIIGAGPAGITCALKLASPHSRVVLLEAGGLDISAESQQMYEGEVVGDTYFPLDVARLRFFGGSSNHWGGWCRPLDQIDFEGKGLARLGRWPIKKSDLDPFLVEAGQILEIKTDFPEVLLSSKLKQITFEFSPPVNFREKYYEQIVRHESIFLCLHANVVQLETDGENVQSLLVQGYDKISYRVRASRYVLACGGIENSRLLLWSNYLANGRLVKAKNSLGRYWFEHPHFTIGETLINTQFGLPPRKNGRRSGTEFFAPTQETIQTMNILNCGLRVIKPPSRLGAKRLIRDIACFAPDWADWAYGRFREGKLCAGVLRAAWEQEPRYENQVALGNEKDQLGIPRVKLNWRKSELDLQTIRTMAKVFGSYLAISNNGRLRIDPWLVDGDSYPENDELVGNHHMGGTRMGDDPDESVVDVNCKVYGQANLYVAGSSVFPSGGHCNPTLTIVQFALRLSRHLKYN